MTIRMNSDEKYQGLRDRMEEAKRAVAQWPSWKIDQSQQKNSSGQTEVTEGIDAPSATRTR